MIDHPLFVGVLDRSIKARSKPASELNRIYDSASGRFYHEVKQYKGMFCIGTKWVELKVGEQA